MFWPRGKSAHFDACLQESESIFETFKPSEEWRSRAIDFISELYGLIRSDTIDSSEQIRNLVQPMGGLHPIKQLLAGSELVRLGGKVLTEHPLGSFFVTLVSTTAFKGAQAMAPQIESTKDAEAVSILSRELPYTYQYLAPPWSNLYEAQSNWLLAVLSFKVSMSGREELAQSLWAAFGQLQPVLESDDVKAQSAARKQEAQWQEMLDRVGSPG